MERQSDAEKEQHRSEIERLRLEARILAPFTGKVLRVDKEPVDQSIRYLILYRSKEEPRSREARED